MTDLISGGVRYDNARTNRPLDTLTLWRAYEANREYIEPRVQALMELVDAGDFERRAAYTEIARKGFALAFIDDLVLD